MMGVRIASDTPMIQSSDWPKWSYLWHFRVKSCFLSDQSSFQMLLSLACQYFNCHWQIGSYVAVNIVMKLFISHNINFISVGISIKSNKQTYKISNKRTCIIKQTKMHLSQYYYALLNFNFITWIFFTRFKKKYIENTTLQNQVKRI